MFMTKNTIVVSEDFEPSLALTVISATPVESSSTVEAVSLPCNCSLQ